MFERAGMSRKVELTVMASLSGIPIIFVCDVFAGLDAEEGRFDTIQGVFSECWSVIVEEVELTRLEHRRCLFRFLTCADDPSRLLRLQRETKRFGKYAHEKCVALRTAPKVHFDSKCREDVWAQTG